MYKIAIDADSTLNNLCEGLVNLYNEIYHDQITMDMFTNYDWYTCFPFEVAERLTNLLLRKELWDSLSPIKDSQKCIKTLMDNNIKVYIATATDPINFHWKVDWFTKFFPFINKKNIICINDKSLLDVDFVVDDCLDQLLSIKFGHRICIDRPWNRNIYDDCYSIHRCFGWKEIVKIINEIIKEEEAYI